MGQLLSYADLVPHIRDVLIVPTDSDPAFPAMPEWQTERRPDGTHESTSGTASRSGGSALMKPRPSWTPPRLLARTSRRAGWLRSCDTSATRRYAADRHHGRY